MTESPYWTWVEKNGGMEPYANVPEPTHQFSVGLTAEELEILSILQDASLASLLTPNEFKVLRLHIFDGRNIKDTSIILGKSRQKIYRLLDKIKVKLRTFVKDKKGENK